ncbi:MAG: hypothetical protein KF696_00275 [Planctomycetes bacterium]|nr:hypothetical protein [Planctomycetota bacterium]MCW8134626.1 hypothetical protein [Planctomycetota bacterium]
MTHEELQILMQRAIDGVIAEKDREVLARAIKADPLLKSEYDDLQSVHAATEQLFRQISLPRDFAPRVMKRLQGLNVPADAHLEPVRLPGQRPAAKRAPMARLHRRKLRIYAGIAAVSAAAAFILSVGVITGAFSRTLVDSPAGTPSTDSVVKDSRGGPGREGENRTDPSNLGHEEREAPAPDSGNGASRDTKPDNLPESGDAGNEAPVREQQPEGRHAPRRDEVEQKPEQGSEPDAPSRGEPEMPKGSQVEEPSQPAAREKPGTEAKPARELGRLVMLAGRVDTLSRDGKWTRLTDGAAVLSDMQLKTSVNGSAMLMTESGNLVMGKATELRFDDTGTASLVKGEVGLERDTGHGEVSLACEGYTVNLRGGYTLVTRKLRGFSLRHVAGFAYVSHAQHESLLLDRVGEAEVDFNKGCGMLVVKDGPARLTVPDWSGEARASMLLARINAALDTREMKRDERSYIDNNLPKGVARLMCHSVDESFVLEFVLSAIENTKFHGKLLVQIVNEVENAFWDKANLDLELSFIARCAGRAAGATEEYKTWKAMFEQLLHPPQPANPVQRPAQPTSNPDPDCPAEAGKVKRVERPQPPKPKPAPGSTEGADKGGEKKEEKKEEKKDDSKGASETEK